MATCVGFIPYNPSKNLIGKPNVFMSDGMSALHTHIALYETLAPLVATKHDWKFVAYFEAHDVIRGFHIFCKSEKLGSVSIVKKAEKYKLLLTNDRICETIVRGRGAHTSDPQRATLIIRKQFYGASITTKAAKAYEHANSVTAELANSLGSLVRSGKDTLFVYMKKFMFANHEAFARTLPDEDTRGTLHAYMENSEALKGVTGFRRKLGQLGQDANANERVMLVIIDQDNYIVRLGNDVSLCTAETLPEDAKTKLGMLKLTEPKSFFADIGCRVSEDTFLIVCRDA